MYLSMICTKLVKRSYPRTKLLFSYLEIKSALMQYINSVFFSSHSCHRYRILSILLVFLEILIFLFSVYNYLFPFSVHFVTIFLRFLNFFCHMKQFLFCFYWRMNGFSFDLSSQGFYFFANFLTSNFYFYYCIICIALYFTFNRAPSQFCGLFF